ncbi:hypothetical protein B0A49_00216 [Cryomyces minteri]|uniref:Urease accessory protein UreF n=1 Tax=Cryomyces minteri TaxID=331657 RepID=A0A4U0XU00_9PEZI|nr:hypothetical protein B0A49_00216 [Cryomyces minteri]
MTPDQHHQRALHDEIADLELRLRHARSLVTPPPPPPPPPLSAPPLLNPSTPTHSSLHALLLLADSALPLGSFAFSSGLESYLAHHKSPPAPSSTSSSASTPVNAAAHQLAAFHTYLHLSLANLGSAALPYVLAAHRNPGSVGELDDEFDATVACAVARRASVSQGRALVGVWEKAFVGAVGGRANGGGSNGVHDGDGDDSSTGTGVEAERNEQAQHAAAATALSAFARLLKRPNPPTSTSLVPSPSPTPHAHLPPLFGALARALALSAPDTAYVFLLSHAKALLSAGVRASVLGPYQAQAVLASAALQREIGAVAAREWHRGVADAGLRSPLADVWGGRHELLYSRIFNS